MAHRAVPCNEVEKFRREKHLGGNFSPKVSRTSRNLRRKLLQTGTHRRVKREIHGVKVEGVEYDMRSSLRRSVEKYEQAVFDATNKWPNIYTVKTAFIEEDTKVSPLHALCDAGLFVECPSCMHSFP